MCLEARFTISLEEEAEIQFARELIVTQKPQPTQDKYSTYWKTQKGLNVLTDWICSLVAGDLLFSLYFSCLILLQSELPIMPTAHGLVLHMEVDFFFFFLTRLSSGSSSYIRSRHRSNCPSSIWHAKCNCSQISSVICCWFFCIAFEGCGMRPLHPPAVRKYSGWWSFVFRRALLQPSAIATSYCMVCCARNVLSFLIRKGDACWRIWG